jgi:hypothetical protein
MEVPFERNSNIRDLNGSFEWEGLPIGEMTRRSYKTMNRQKNYFMVNKKYRPLKIVNASISMR